VRHPGRRRRPRAGPGRHRCPRPPAADILWALEHALKGGHLGAVLAWLPARLPADALRRLQLAAQSHEGPVFLLRDAAQRSQPSAAPLRLLLGSAGPDLLRVHLAQAPRPAAGRSRCAGAAAGAVGPGAARALRGGQRGAHRGGTGGPWGPGLRAQPPVLWRLRPAAVGASCAQPVPKAAAPPQATPHAAVPAGDGPLDRAAAACAWISPTL
jgi:hypothetical protein